MQVQSWCALLAAMPSGSSVRRAFAGAVRPCIGLMAMFGTAGSVRTGNILRGVKFLVTRAMLLLR